MDTRDWEALFDTENPTPGWMSGVLRQRSAVTRAGDILYLASYPVWDTQTGKRAAGIRPTKAAQRKVNDRRAKLKLEQLINANFGDGDLLITCTYRDDRQPEDAERARKDIRNYLLKIRRMRERRRLEELRYVYVTETTHSGRRGTRYHHHLIVNGDGVTREELEAAWMTQQRSVGRIGFCNTRRAQETEEGLSGWANYITKSGGKPEDGKEQENGIATKRRWCRSRNLTVPETRTSDKRISRRRVEKLAAGMETEAKAILESICPGYELIDCSVRESSYVPGAYIRARLRRKKPKRRSLWDSLI